MHPPSAVLFSISCALMLMLALAAAGCGSDESPDADVETAPAAQASPDMPEEALVDTLTQRQRARLGPALQRFVTGDSTATGDIVSEGEMRDGEKVFSVLIESNDAQALRDAGIPLTSVAGSIITARLTMSEILQVADMEGVQSIRTDRDVESTAGSSTRPQMRSADDSAAAPSMPSRSEMSSGGGNPSSPSTGGGSPSSGGGSPSGGGQ